MNNVSIQKVKACTVSHDKDIYFRIVVKWDEMFWDPIGFFGALPHVASHYEKKSADNHNANLVSSSYIQWLCPNSGSVSIKGCVFCLRKDS